MTIAIGMLYDSGVVMSADSLVTTGTLGSYQSKILAYRIDGADVVFALAGNVDLAESAWQLCEPAITKHAGRKASARDIANSLRPVLAKEYKEHVLDCGYVGTHYDYSFLIAIRVDGAKAELYHTYLKTLKKSRKWRECIGAGADLASLLLGWVAGSHLSVERLTERVAHAVAILKLEMSGVIGGNNLVLALTDDGRILFYTVAGLDLLERYGAEYDVHARDMLWSFLDTSVDEAKFKESLETFCNMVKATWGAWKAKRDAILFSTAPSESKQAIIDLRSHPDPAS
jgi:hypothetical protein